MRSTTQPLFEILETRQMMSLTAAPTGLEDATNIPFIPSPVGVEVMPATSGVITAQTSGSTLTVFGTSANDTLTISRDAAGKILVNSGAVVVKGFTPTVANIVLIQVFGQGGNDNLSLNESTGALPAAQLFGGVGNDTLIGGSGADMLFGQSGNDQLLAKGGNDFLFGGADNDSVTGGDGDDQSFGESGNDRMIWNPGDDTDLNEGGDGSDTVEVNGGNGAETFTATQNGTRVRFDRLNPAPFSIDIGTSENLVLNANGGDDVFTGSNGLAPLITLTVDGGNGNDSITGGDGNDSLLGGDGSDLVNGARGNDVALLAAGDDAFVWNPGDGSDIVEGQDGTDSMLFNGANINEKFNLSPNGSRVRFTRDVATITMDLNGVEKIDLNALGGVDSTLVNDMSGTDLAELNINLAGSNGLGDGAADSVIVNGTFADDVIVVTGDSSGTAVLGLATRVNIVGGEAANDQLNINALAGDDVVEGSGLAANAIRFSADGGDGNDVLVGGAGNDTLIGGAGDDVLVGNGGNDVLNGFPGNDVLIQ